MTDDFLMWGDICIGCAAHQGLIRPDLRESINAAITKAMLTGDTEEEERLRRARGI